MREPVDITKLGLTNESITYQDMVASERAKVLRAYCSSPKCSPSRPQTLKKSINPNLKTESDEGSIYYKRPIDCPDCGYALIWKREEFK